MQLNPLEQRNRQQRKSASGNPPIGIILGIVFVIIGVFVLIFSPSFGIFWIVIGCFFISAGAKAAKEQQARQHTAPPRAAQTTQSRQAQTTKAQNQRSRDQTSREASIQNSLDNQTAPSAPTHCDNPEPHLHAQPRRTAEDYERQSREKRRESMGHLYEAGLLTKEEYANELRRL